MGVVLDKLITNCKELEELALYNFLTLKEIKEISPKHPYYEHYSDDETRITLDSYYDKNVSRIISDHESLNRIVKNFGEGLMLNEKAWIYGIEMIFQKIEENHKIVFMPK